MTDSEQRELMADLGELERDLAAAIPPGRPAISPRPYVPTLKEVMAANYPLDVATGIIDDCRAELAEWLKIHPEPESSPPATMTETVSQIHFECPGCHASHSIEKYGLVSPVVTCGCGQAILLA